jgi:hypothetical protein
MIRITLAVFAVLFSFHASTASSGQIDYTCTVRHVYSLQENGSLETSLPPHPESEMEKQMKKDSFTISRETGAIKGKASTLDTSAAKSTLVIHKGSEENSFETVADYGTFKSGTHPYQVIKVKEYLKGSEKPFVAMGDMEVITGICR